jgi:hypothetical protein
MNTRARLTAGLLRFAARLGRQLGALPLMVLALDASACRQIVGFDHTPGASGSREPGTRTTATTCNLPYATSDCASCVEAHCCEESAACGAVDACKRQLTCLQACGSEPECRARCGFEAPVSQASVAPTLAACLAGSCETECGLGCGLALRDYGDTQPEIATKCHNCIGANACDSAAACAASADCDGYRRCFATCRAPDCKQACAETHAEGAALDAALLAASTACNDDCARGRNWSCVGRVTGSKPKSDMVALTVDFFHSTSIEAFANLDIAVCDGQDVQCLHPRAQSKTDAMGRVAFTLQQHGNSTNTTVPAFGLDGYVQVTSPEVNPFFTYWGFAITEPRYRFWIGAPTRAEVDGLLTAYKVSLNPSRGNLIASLLDCEGLSAKNVVVTLEPSDPDTQVGYGLSPGATETDQDGWALFFNVPEGTVNVTATPSGLGKPSSKKTVNVRVGWTTAIWLSPTE